VQLERHIEKLEHQAETIVQADRKLARQFCHLVSVRGIARVSALHLLAELVVLAPDMTARQVFAILSLALAGNIAHAVEAEQFEPQSTLTRAEALAQSDVAQPLLLSGGEATQFVVDRSVQPVMSRDDIRAEARQGLVFSELYVA